MPLSQVQKLREFCRHLIAEPLWPNNELKDRLAGILDVGKAKEQFLMNKVGGVGSKGAKKLLQARLLHQCHLLNFVTDLFCLPYDVLRIFSYARQ